MNKNNSNNKKEFEITIDSNIMEVLEKFPRAAEIFAEYGLPCAGCAAASYERISDIIGEFGVDGEEFVKAINNSVESE
jgi:hybrid cluster-associated redox disulfide protein